MNLDGVVEPGDNELQTLLALVAEHNDDQERRDFLYDFILTCPPLHEWPMGSQDRLAETCHYVTGLARSLRGDRAGGTSAASSLYLGSGFSANPSVVMASQPAGGNAAYPNW